VNVSGALIQVGNLAEEQEVTTVWSFPQRGNWATHNPDYPGNFAPQVPRNVLEMYTQKGDSILDPMVGAGTTLIEARVLGRNALGLDINPQAIELAERALQFRHDSPTWQRAQVGDARDLRLLADGSFDLVVTHPPYMNIIRYSEGKIAGELYRVLKGDRHCAILIGDTRRGRHYVPLAYQVMQRFLRAGFVLKEDIIKVQHNCRQTGRWRWKARRDRFYLIMHEHLFVFRKPKPGEDLSRIKYSTGRPGSP